MYLLYIDALKIMLRYTLKIQNNKPMKWFFLCSICLGQTIF